MRYLLMIYDDEAGFEAASDADREAMRQAYGTVASGWEERGVIRGGDELAPTASATTVRIRSGERLVTDGPFAETKEQLGGYFIVDVADLDAAIELAAQLPGAHSGSIEVRPILDM